MRVEQFLVDSALRWPDRTALACGKARFTFAELDAMSDGFAGAISRGGIVPGCRVAVFLDSYWETTVAIFGVLKAGAVFLPLPSSIRRDELAPTLSTLRPVCLVTEVRLAARTAAAMAGTEVIRLVVLAGTDDAPPAAGCMRFEDMLRGGRPSVPLLAEDADASIIAGPAGIAAQVITHAEVSAAVAADDAFCVMDNTVLGSPPLWRRDGLIRMFAAVKAGATPVRQGGTEPVPRLRVHRGPRLARTG